MEEISVWLFFILLSFRNIGDRFQWMFIVVYGPTANENRGDL